MIEQKSQRITLVAVFFLFTTLAAYADDKLDAFKRAAGQEGCSSIPYSDLRERCERGRDDVHPWCDGDRGPVSCDKNETSVLLGKLASAHKRNEELSRRKSELNVEIGRADKDEKDKLRQELADTEKELTRSDNTIRDLEYELKVKKEDVEKTMGRIDKCINGRIAEMNVFAAALDKVRGETGEEIEPLARQLRDRYEASKRDHVYQIEKRNESMEICKRALP